MKDPRFRPPMDHVERVLRGEAELEELKAESSDPNSSVGEDDKTASEDQDDAKTKSGDEDDVPNPTELDGTVPGEGS